MQLLSDSIINEDKYISLLKLIFACDAFFEREKDDKRHIIEQLTGNICLLLNNGIEDKKLSKKLEYAYELRSLLVHEGKIELNNYELDDLYSYLLFILKKSVRNLVLSTKYKSSQSMVDFFTMVDNRLTFLKKQIAIILINDLKNYQSQ